MKVAIMQPYFLPYIGYFQLISSVDVFVIYDNIQYTKKGWINRNRFLKNNQDEYFTIPIKKDSDFLCVNQRFLSDNLANEKIKLKNQIKSSYLKAPYFNEVFQLFENIVDNNKDNLFEFIYYSIQNLCLYLEIETKIIKSSTLTIDHTLKGREKVKAICQQIQASTYINPIGGMDLYDKSDFKRDGIDLYFIKSDNIEYKQFGENFVPWLSILDVLMFNSVDQIKIMLKKYTLL